MSAPGTTNSADAVERIDGFVDDIASAIDTARRLVRTGNPVDLTPLEQDVCELTDMIAAAGLARGGEIAVRLAQSLRAVIEGLDRLEADLTSIMAATGAADGAPTGGQS